MKQLGLISLVLLLLSGCSRELRMGRKIKMKFDQNPVFQQAFSGLVVQDALTGKIITNINGDKYFTPASNTKVTTLLTALAILPDTLPSLAYEIHGDSLIFWGTGNPSFLDDRMEWDSVTYRFLAENKRTLYFCASNFKTTGLGSGWAWDDTPYRFSAERSPFPIYKNVLNGIPFVYSNSLLAQILTDTLHKKVVALQQCTNPSAKATKLKTVIADSVYAIMMQQSDNLMAEQLLLMAADTKAEFMAEDTIIAYAKKNLLAPINVYPKWVDGSGLSRYNKIRPKDMIAMIDYLLRTQTIKRLENIFPQGAVKGSIKNGYPSYVFAKTGTMTGVHSLSGFMKTKRGRLVIFSFMHNNYLPGSKVYKPEMRKILALIWREW